MRQFSKGPRSMLAPAGYLATAATVAPAAAAGGSSGSNDMAALRSSATDPSPFIAAGLSRTGSLSRRNGVTSGVIVGDVTYPGNLNLGDLVYFLVAPTLTYQLNFPRLRQRRMRLLSRWLLLAVLTALAMGFMQVGGGVGSGRNVGLILRLGRRGRGVRGKGRRVLAAAAVAGCADCFLHVG